MIDTLRIDLDNNGIPLIEKVLNALEKAIISGDIVPGDHLSEAGLAKSLGISRAPVREALIRLEEANVVKKTYNGREVVKISNKDLEEFHEVKLLLEVHAATTGCQKASKKTITRLSELTSKMEYLVDNNSNDFLELQRINHKFHDMLVKSSGNKKLYDTYLKTAKQIRWTTSLSVSNMNINKSSLKDHRAIFQAFSQGDAPKLAHLLKKHGEQFVKSITGVGSN
ncbi:MAG: GntR family transcriptional regulator [Desulfobacterales bacterium]|nr:GntR family transcriptional regulator [Desulfobacterales bacterium]